MIPIIFFLLLYAVSGVLLLAALKDIFGTVRVSGKWIGKRGKVIFDLPQEKEVIELHLPDGSSAQMTLDTARKPENVYNPDGGISDAFIARMNPALFEPLSTRKGSFVIMAVSLYLLICGNYGAAVLYKYSFPQTYYALEAAFIAAIFLYNYMQRPQQRAGNWDAYKRALADREKKLDTSFGPVDKKSAFNLNRIQENFDSRRAEKTRSPGSNSLVVLPLIFAFFIFIQWLNIRPLHEPHALTVAEITDIHIEHIQKNGSICQATVQFQHQSASRNFLRTANLYVDTYSPYCQRGGEMEVVYNPDNEESAPVIYTNGWNEGVEVLLVMGFIFSCGFCYKVRSR